MFLDYRCSVLCIHKYQFVYGTVQSMASGSAGDLAIVAQSLDMKKCPGCDVMMQNSKMLCAGCTRKEGITWTPEAGMKECPGGCGSHIKESRDFCRPCGLKQTWTPEPGMKECPGGCGSHIKLTRDFCRACWKNKGKLEVKVELYERTPWQ